MPALRRAVTVAAATGPADLDIGLVVAELVSDMFVNDKVDIRQEWKRSRLPELAATRSIFTSLRGNVDMTCFDRPLLVAFQHAYLRLPRDNIENPAFGRMAC